MAQRRSWGHLRGTPVASNPLAPGQIYWVEDQSLRLENASGTRSLHDKRPVIVVQGELACKDARLPLALVVPCSHQPPAHGYDYILPQEGLEQTGLPAVQTIALVTNLQPMRKTLLTDLAGELTLEMLTGLRAKVVSFLGIPAGPVVSLPPR